MSNKELVANLTTAIVAELSIDNANGDIVQRVDTDKPEVSLYEKNADTVTMEAIKAVKTYDTNFVAATARAATQLANGGFTANKDLASATVTLPMFHKDTVTVTANRDGALDVSVTNRAVDPSAGELKKVFHDFKAAMKEASTA